MHVIKTIYTGHQRAGVGAFSKALLSELNKIPLTIYDIFSFFVLPPSPPPPPNLLLQDYQVIYLLYILGMSQDRSACKSNPNGKKKIMYPTYIHAIAVPCKISTITTPYSCVKNVLTTSYHYQISEALATCKYWTAISSPW